MTAESPPRRRDPGATTPRGPIVAATQPDVPTVPVRADVLEAVAQLLAEAADLREREVLDAWRRGYLAGSLDPELLRVTWETAWEVAQDRLVAALVNYPDLGPPLAERIAARRAAVQAWVRGETEYPGWAA